MPVALRLELRSLMQTNFYKILKIHNAYPGGIRTSSYHIYKLGKFEMAEVTKIVGWQALLKIAFENSRKHVQTFKELKEVRKFITENAL